MKWIPGSAGSGTARPGGPLPGLSWRTLRTPGAWLRMAPSAEKEMLQESPSYLLSKNQQKSALINPTPPPQIWKRYSHIICLTLSIVRCELYYTYLYCVSF
jgi:hypothetical protein